MNQNNDHTPGSEGGGPDRGTLGGQAGGDHRQGHGQDGPMAGQQSQQGGASGQQGDRSREERSAGRQQEQAAPTGGQQGAGADNDRDGMERLQATRRQQGDESFDEGS